MNPEQLEQETLRALATAQPVFETLVRLNSPEYPAVLPTITPREGDLAKAFDARVLPQLAPLFATMWATPPRALGVSPGQSDLRVVAATTALLGFANPISDNFPGGYRRMAELLVPGRVWVAWKYVRPGASSGMAFDGLVWLDDHWAWFPKPWRGLRLPTA